MLRIAICDDEKDCLNSTQDMLNLYMAEKKLSYRADSFCIPSDLFDVTEKGMIFDIYLLYIYMPGITGMSIATELRSHGYAPRFARPAARFRQELIAKYGEERGSKIRYAEAYQICEYGYPLTEELYKKFFPF